MKGKRDSKYMRPETLMISNGLIRLSIRVAHYDDLIRDIKQALSYV